MPPKTLAKIGLALSLVSAAFFWGSEYWLTTRMFEPVNMPVSLEAGRAQTIRFTSNLREDYWIGIQADYSADDWREGAKCDERSLWKMAWKMYRFRGDGTGKRELWATREEGEEHYRYLWNIPSGRYELEWSVPDKATCLNARHPQLRIGTDPGVYQDAVGAIRILCVVVAGTGLMLVLRVAANYALGRVFARAAPRMFPEIALRSVVPMRRHPLMPVISYPASFGVAWSSILMVLAFIFLRYLLMRPPSHGLPLEFRSAQALMKPSPWTETLGVYVSQKRQFLVNGQAVSRASLRAKLEEELGKRVVWTVYVEADANSVFEDTVYSMDTIQSVGAKVIWITPGMRREWEQEARQTEPAYLP